MMSVEDQAETSRNRSGFLPDLPLAIGPIWSWPPKPLKVIRAIFGFPGYVLPWHLTFLAIAVGSFLYLSPDLESVRTAPLLSAGKIFVRNCALLLCFAGALHTWLYIFKAQDTEFKYNSSWPSVGNKKFLFQNQVRDNIFFNFFSAVPIWTAYEFGTHWLMATGRIATVNWHDNTLYLVALTAITPIWTECHFYFAHRFLHIPFLYDKVHYLHHKNINVGPWSGLAMHPVEHLLFFTGVLLFWIVPASPFNAIYYLTLTGLGPSLGHQGFDRIKIGKSRTLSSAGYMHFLHHKYVTVNYASDRLFLPLDRWLGTFHDGSRESMVAFQKRKKMGKDA